MITARKIRRSLGRYQEQEAPPEMVSPIDYVLYITAGVLLLEVLYVVFKK